MLNVSINKALLHKSYIYDFPPNLGVGIAIFFQLRMPIIAKENKVLEHDFKSEC